MLSGFAAQGLHDEAVAAVAFAAIVIGAWGDWTGRWEIPFLHSALSYAAESTGVEVPQQRLLASWDDVQPDLEEKCQLNPGAPECQAYFAETASYLRRARAKSNKKKGGGSDLNVFYINNRVIDRDQFTVRVVA